MIDFKKLPLKNLPMPIRVAIVAVIAVIVVLKMTGVLGSERNDGGEIASTPVGDVVSQPETDAGTPDETEPQHDAPRAIVRGDGGIAEHFANGRGGVQVRASGVVFKVLPDDNDGSRHQRFLVQLDSDMTIMIAHNIDLAPHVPCEEGDVVAFYGVYEWSERGGTVHWTHHDPGGRHVDGWIEHDGTQYD